jgi:hypothetical protein
MKLFALTFIGLVPLLQVSDSVALASDPARLIGTASVLGSLTVLVYRLGVWRQEMENIRNNVGAEVKAYREQSAANFERIESRLAVLDRLVLESADLRTRVTRTQERLLRRLERLEKERDE